MSREPPEPEEDTEGNAGDARHKRFSGPLRRPIENLRPEFKAKGVAKAERVDERIRKVENRGRFFASRTRDVAIKSASRTRDVATKTKGIFKRNKDRKGTSFVRNTKANFNARLAGLATRFRTTDFTLIQSGAGKFVLEPKFIPKRFFDVPRTSQWMAAFLLPVIIIVSFAIETAILQIFEDVLLNSGDLGDQSAIFGFFATAIGLGLYILGAWGWFLWIRTGGFKLFDF